MLPKQSYCVTKPGDPSLRLSTSESRGDGPGGGKHGTKTMWSERSLVSSGNSVRSARRRLGGAGEEAEDNSLTSFCFAGQDCGPSKYVRDLTLFSNSHEKLLCGLRQRSDIIQLMLIKGISDRE